MFDIQLSFQPPLVKNPEPDWLADHSGDHFDALRLFHEACWAWASFQSQHTQPYASVRWGHTIASKADLYDYAIDCRRQALLNGFFLLTAEQLDELAALPNLSENQEEIFQQFLALCDRHDETRDLYGQDLPAPLYEILRLIEQAPPFKQQGECALTKRIRIGKRVYFAKLTDETLSGKPPTGQDEFNEVSSVHALLALHPGIGPACGYHLIAADGQHCALVAEVPGKIYRESQIAKTAKSVNIEWLHWIVLAEWLFGLEDRHFENLVVDKITRRAGIIDMAFSWRISWDFLGWNEDDPPLRFCESYARAMFEHLDPSLTFPREVLQEVCEREGAVLAALAPFPMPDETLILLRRQFAILQDVLKQYPEDIRLDTIEQMARSWYNGKRTREGGEHA